MNLLPKAADEGNLESGISCLDSEQFSQADLDLALGRACCSGHYNIAELLLARGADPNGQYETASGKFEYGPIILASCEFLNPDGVKWLLDRGANPEGNPPESGHFQCMTPLQMVHDTYVEHEANKQKCIELLNAAGAK